MNDNNNTLKDTGKKEINRIPPKKMAMKIANLLREQQPDPNYVKKIFEHVRYELGIRGGKVRVKKLPELLTDDEIKRFYEAVWNTADATHMIMIKLLLYTGIRNSELSNIQLTDVDLKSLKIRIQEGKGKKDRYVPIPKSFRGELAQYLSFQKEKKSKYLFETNRNNKFSTRWIREIFRNYAIEAKIEKRIYPHLFRHQLLTYLTQSGLVDAKIQLISGHSDRKSLSIYQDLSLADIQEEYQEAMEKFPVK